VTHFISGTLSDPELTLATMGICIGIMELGFTLLSGVCSAVSIWVSNLLGMLKTSACSHKVSKFVTSNLVLQIS
jgi:Na+-driven multidrug efflux pump